MQTYHFLLLKILKNTESAQLWKLKNWQIRPGQLDDEKLWLVGERPLGLLWKRFISFSQSLFY